MPNFVFTPNTGGTISITTRRSFRQMAPDSIRFEVDLSQANFDTPGPDAGTPYYDTRMHKLYYFWDLGDPGTWGEPVNVLTAWKNRNVAKGPSVKHLYREPGNYTVSVLVIEPSSGKTATATLDVSVSDPQDFYGDANTIYVNNVGDSDFSYVPAGVPTGNKINIDRLEQNKNVGTFTPDATWSARKGTSCRWRFKRGGSWDVSINMHSADGVDPSFDAYGDPNEPRPVFNVMQAGDPSKSQIFSFTYSFDQNANGATGRQFDTALWNYDPPEVRIRDIHFQGPFDAVTDYPGTGPFCGLSLVLGAIRKYMVDCKIDGFGSSVVNAAFQPTPGTNREGTVGLHDLHIDNCAFTNFGGEYCVFWTGAEHPDSSVTTTGVRWQQPGDALGPGVTNNVVSRSCLRAGSKFQHARGCDVFMTDISQPGLTFWKTPISDGVLIVANQCGIEGGAVGVSIAGNFGGTPEQRSYTGNAIIEDIIYLACAESVNAIGTNMSGITIRNILAVWPAVAKFSNGCNGLVMAQPLFGSEVTIPDYVLDAPIEVYNCTLRMDRTMAQNSQTNAYVPKLFDTNKPPNDDWKNSGSPSVPQPFTAVSEANNILHFPNLIAFPNTTEVNAEHIAFAPLSENVLWQSRYLGYRSADDGVLQTQYATPLNSLFDTKPLAGSAAIGAALNGDVAYDSLGASGVKRPVPPSKGPWEPA